MKKMRIRNSSSNRIEEIIIRKDKLINLYLCGPTVYSDVHIGNIRPSVLFDVLIRTMREIGLKVNYLQNITDIDDKIIKKAKEENLSEEQVANFYSKLFLKSFDQLQLIRPNFQKVTDNLEKILIFIRKLEKQQSIYQTKDGIFFEVNKYHSEYGKLSNQKLEKLSNERGRGVNQQTEKKDWKDFAIWKKTEEGVQWESQWLSGRPGWHTECVALIDHFFASKTIDIHGGGKDLLFPHHENEEVQYFAANQRELSRLWIHFGHLNFNNQKMSKSLGNYMKLEQFIEEKGVNTLKFLFFNSGDYNEDINITNETITQAYKQQEKLEAVVKRIKLKCHLKGLGLDQILRKNKKTSEKEKAVNFLLDNLQTNKVVSLLEDLINQINQTIEKNEQWENNIIQEKISSLFLVSELVGILTDKKDYSQEKIKLIDKWRSCNERGDYLNSDKIREEMKIKKIIP